MFCKKRRSVAFIGNFIEIIGESIEVMDYPGLVRTGNKASPGSQCADITMMTSGRGRVAPRSSRLRVNRFDSTMFIGDPCPIKSTGIFCVALAKVGLPKGYREFPVIKFGMMIVPFCEL